MDTQDGKGPSIDILYKPVIESVWFLDFLLGVEELSPDGKEDDEKTEDESVAWYDHEQTNPEIIPGCMDADEVCAVG